MLLQGLSSAPLTAPNGSLLHKCQQHFWPFWCHQHFLPSACQVNYYASSLLPLSVIYVPGSSPAEAAAAAAATDSADPAEFPRQRGVIPSHFMGLLPFSPERLQFRHAVCP